MNRIEYYIILKLYHISFTYKIKVLSIDKNVLIDLD